MKGDYPRFTSNLSHEELIEHFQLGETEHQFITQFRGDANRHGVAILLKSLQYLGYFPQHLGEVPAGVKLFVARQLSMPLDLWEQYPWQTTTRDNHFARIRQHTGFRFATAGDKEDLENWLRTTGAFDAITFSDLFYCAILRLSELRIELPSEKELTRIVNAALNHFFLDAHHQISDELSVEIREKLDRLLVVPADESISTFEKIKRPAGPSGVASLLREIDKLQTLRCVGIVKAHLTNLPFSVQKQLSRRATNEKGREMRRHPDEIRYGLMSCFITLRTMEVIDSIVQMFLQLIHRIDVRAEKQRDNQLLRDLSHVDGKTQILFRIAEVVMENPDGTIRDVIFPAVKEQTFRNLVAEKKASGPSFRHLHHRLMKQKFTYHYRRMLPLVLQHITFRSDNRFQPIISALAVIKQYLSTSYKYFPIPVPIEGVVTGNWKDTVIEPAGTATKVNRKYYEICVLQQLERALKCKDIWVEGSYEWGQK